MNLANHLQALEEHLLDASVRHDPAELTYLLAPEFLEFGSSGRTFTLDQIIADLAAESQATTRTLSDFTLLSSTPDWALVTYRTSSSEGRKALRSSTWIYRDGRWQIIFHQGTLTA